MNNIRYDMQNRRALRRSDAWGEYTDDTDDTEQDVNPIHMIRDWLETHAERLEITQK